MCVCEWISYTITGTVKECTEWHSFSGKFDISAAVASTFFRNQQILFCLELAVVMVSSQTQTDLSGQYHVHSIENETVCIVQAMCLFSLVWMPGMEFIVVLFPDPFQWKIRETSLGTRLSLLLLSTWVFVSSTPSPSPFSFRLRHPRKWQ